MADSSWASVKSAGSGVERETGDLVEHSQLLQLHPEGLVPIGRLTSLADGGEAARLLDADAPIGADDARAELDRGEVPFADRSQAQDEALLPGAEPTLVGGGDDGRVGERRSFDGVLVCEVGPDEEPPLHGELIPVGDQAGHTLVVAQQRAIKVRVPLGELRERRGERRGDRSLREGQDPIDDLLGSPVAVRRDVRAGHERPDDHPPGIGAKADLRSVDRYHAGDRSPGPQGTAVAVEWVSHV